MLAAGTMLMMSAMVSTQAFLVKETDKLMNQIAPGNVAVMLTEPHWNPETEIRMEPGSSTEKDPVVKNSGSLDAWIFLKVKVPKRKIICVDPKTHRKEESRTTELFSFRANEKWKLIEKQDSEDLVSYIYGYETTVKPKESTESLFDAITMIEYLEGELKQDEILQIPIEATAIQWNVSLEQAGVEAAYHSAFGGDGE